MVGAGTLLALGRWSLDFYRRQPATYGTDSGFRELGYLILAITEADESAGRERVTMQHAQGLDDVRWMEASEATTIARTLAPHGHRGGSFRQADGHIDPPRNVRAYSLAMQRAGVELREGVAFTGLRTDAGGRVTAVQTSAGTIETGLVLLTGGPSLRAVGELAGMRIPVGAARHTVAVLEPHAAFAEPQPMVFNIAAGLYWRLEEGGLLFGWSDPDETPGEAREVDWAAYDRYRKRLAGYVPVTRGLGLRRIWAATIDYTPGPRADHRPGDPVRRELHPGGDRGGSRRARDDVGPGHRARRRGPRAPRRNGGPGCDGPWPGPLRRARAKPAGDRPRHVALSSRGGLTQQQPDRPGRAGAAYVGERSPRP